MEYFTITDTGRVRKNNEDNYYSQSTNEFSLFIICDGMGGHNAGEVASMLACDLISRNILENIHKTDPDDLFDLIAESVRLAHNKIVKKSLEDKSRSNMGTTMVLSLIVEDILYYANVGDSRIYIYNENGLEQITRDHSFVQELLDSGAITEEEAAFYPRNQITSALGAVENYKIDIKKQKLKYGDLILMASDGLTDLIDDEDIEDVLSNGYNVRESCDILKYMANSTGGKDNITITIAKLIEEDNDW